MGWEDLPDGVKDAIQRDDKEALSRAGKKGAKVRAENAEIRKESQKEADKKYMIEHTYNDILHKEGEEAAGAYKESLKE